MQSLYQKGLYLAVQPILSQEISSEEALISKIRTLLPSCPENQDYVDALLSTPHTPTRYQRLTALHCLLTLMAEFAPNLAATLRLYRDDNGRPYGESTLNNPPAFDFNMTHTQGYVACALLLGYGKVGIDAEPLIPTEKAKKISARFFTPNELSYLQRVDDETYGQEATRLWTAKEALSKQDGRGFPLNFDGLAIDPSLRLYHFSMTSPSSVLPLYLTLCAPSESGVLKVVRAPNGGILTPFHL